MAHSKFPETDLRAARDVSAADPVPDSLVLRDHVREVEIGAFQCERGRRQRVRFDVTAEMKARRAVASDDVDAVVSYDCLHEAVSEELSSRRFETLERLADGIAARVLAQRAIASVRIRIEKLDIVSGGLGIEIVRHGQAAPIGTGDTLPVRVVFLDRETLGSPGLTTRFDALMADGAAVLCIDRIGSGTPQVKDPRSQWRIDLLALEQAAWQLASRDQRCIVVSSRTELTWGLRHGQLSVWAPSKLVLDSREPVVPLATTPRDLALWLAAELGASGLTPLP